MQSKISVISVISVGLKLSIRMTRVRTYAGTFVFSTFAQTQVHLHQRQRAPQPRSRFFVFFVFFRVFRVPRVLRQLSVTFASITISLSVVYAAVC